MRKHKNYEENALIIIISADVWLCRFSLRDKKKVNKRDSRLSENKNNKYTMILFSVASSEPKRARATKLKPRAFANIQRQRIYRHHRAQSIFRQCE